MKLFQQSLRALIAAGSLAGFFGGWALLAHAGKPVPADSVSSGGTPDMNPPAVVAPAPLPTLPPLEGLSPAQPGPSQLQPLPSLPSVSQFARPRLRTRGS